MFILFLWLQKRVVTRMHLIKDENGLGIHIAGGKGSKNGDIGIFVAGVSEGGAAHRWELHSDYKK